MTRILVLVQMVGLATLIARTVDSVLDGVLYAAAVMAALEVLRRTVGKPLMRFYRRADSAFDLISALPGRLGKIESRLDKIEQQTGADLTVEHRLHTD